MVSTPRYAPCTPTSNGMVGSDWGCRLVLEALEVVHADLPQLQGPLPEVSPSDRYALMPALT